MREDGPPFTLPGYRVFVAASLAGDAARSATPEPNGLLSLAAELTAPGIGGTERQQAQAAEGVEPADALAQLSCQNERRRRANQTYADGSDGDRPACLRIAEAASPNAGADH